MIDETLLKRIEKHVKENPDQSLDQIIEATCTGLTVAETIELHVEWLVDDEKIYPSYNGCYSVDPYVENLKSHMIITSNGMSSQWEDAACRGVATKFFTSNNSKHISLAKGLCESCPVRVECLEYILSLEGVRRYGIYGGFSAAERAFLFGGDTVDLTV